LLAVTFDYLVSLVHRGRQRHSGITSEFGDRWGGLDNYMIWLCSVVVPTAEALRDSGAPFVHCDWRVSHHIRVSLDSVLGAASFRNEIIWHYRRWTAARSSLPRLHQTIFYYARSERHQPDIPRVGYLPTTNLDQIWQARTRDENQITMYAMNGETPRNNGAKEGVPLGDVWEIPPLTPNARERVGYPTQKPLVLLERIIEMACRPGGVVLDPCCGSIAQ
jgi:site-specific DNA-methyltransferase (adenine-specific)